MRNIPSLSSASVADNPELIELLVTEGTGTSGENFFDKLQSILGKTPKIGTTSQPDFFTYTIIGAFTVLPNTHLMAKLNIKQIYINPIKSYEKNKEIVKTVKVALQLESLGKKSLQFYTFCTTAGISEGQHWSQNEISEVLDHLEIKPSDLQAYKLGESWQISGKIYQIDSKFLIDEIDLEIMPFTTESSHGYFSNPKFKRITPLSVTSEIALDANFQALSSYTEVVGVQEHASAIFKDLAKLYQHWQTVLNLGTSEACYHGYSSGVLEFLFKYQYKLDIGVERILGKGRADMVFLSRAGGFYINLQAIPVCVEFKAGIENPNDGLQQIEAKGYMKYTPRMRTSATEGVVLGVNFDANFVGAAVVAATSSIQVESRHFIAEILAEVSKQAASTNMVQIKHDEIQEKISEILNEIGFLKPHTNGAKDNSNYHTPFLLGDAMGSPAINQAHGEVITLSEDPQGKFTLTFSKEINKEIVESTDLEFNADSIYCKSSKIGGNLALPKPNSLVGNDKLYTINPFAFIKENGVIDGITIKEVLKQLKHKGFDIINSEGDLQAFMHGGLSASGYAQVFTESNHLKGGRADLVVSMLMKVGIQHPLKLIELKYADSDVTAARNQVLAMQQVRRYVKNLKSFTDAAAVELIGITYNSNPTNDDQLLLYNSVTENIVHTSGSEDVPHAPRSIGAGVTEFTPKKLNPDVIPASGFRTPIDSSDFKIMEPPDKGFEGDKENSPVKKQPEAAVVGTILGGVVAALGALSLAAGATAAVAAGGGAATGAVAITELATANAALTQVLETATPGMDDIADLQTELTDYVNELTQAGREFRHDVNRHAKLSKKAESIKEKYKIQVDAVKKKFNNKRQFHETERVVNKAKAARVAVPSRRRRELALHEDTSLHDFTNLFSICKIKRENPQLIAAGEVLPLDCYLKIDYQNQTSSLIDMSLWDLSTPLRYLRNENNWIVALPFLFGDEKKLLLPDAHTIQYELIDINAHIIPLFWNEVQQSSYVEESLALAPSTTTEISTSPVSLPSTTEISAASTPSVEAMQCITLVTLNSPKFLNITISHTFDQKYAAQRSSLSIELLIDWNRDKNIYPIYHWNYNPNLPIRIYNNDDGGLNRVCLEQSNAMPLDSKQTVNFQIAIQELTSVVGNQPLLRLHRYIPCNYWEIIGSLDDDHIAVGPNMREVQGGEGKDSYSIRAPTHVKIIRINNYSQDEKIDVLFIETPFETINYYKYGNDLVVSLTDPNVVFPKIEIYSYCRPKQYANYQHLRIQASEGVSLAIPPCGELTELPEHEQADWFEDLRCLTEILGHVVPTPLSIGSNPTAKRSVQTPLRIESASGMNMKSSISWAPLILATPVMIFAAFTVVNRNRRVNARPVDPLAGGAQAWVAGVPLLALPLVEAATSNTVVACQPENFFTAAQCIKHDAFIGLLVYCNNGKKSVAWLKKASLKRDYLYIDPAQGCRQKIEFASIPAVDIAVLYAHLPEEVQEQLAKLWHAETAKNKPAVTLKQQFNQHAAQIGLSYLLANLLLHTSAGDCLQALGLKPDWRQHDHSNIVSRWVTTGCQLANNGYAANALAAALVETASLYRPLQEWYTYLLPEKDLWYAKQTMRFIADCLQFNFHPLSQVPSLIELMGRVSHCNPMVVHSVAWALRAAQSLFLFTDDSDACYLGMALFLLPQIPMLLEHMGVPVTRYLAQSLEKLQTLFIQMTLLNSVLAPIKPDASRKLTHEHDLNTAEQRVTQGRQRWSVVNTLFFMPTTAANESTHVQAGLSRNRS